MKKNMSPLFEVPIVKTEEDYASEFLGKLKKMGFIEVNMLYLTNYIDADLSIALSHIKEGYKKYVSTKKWTEEKYLHVVLILAKERKMLIPASFLKCGIKYDEGKLKREVDAEIKKHKLALLKSNEKTTLINEDNNFANNKKVSKEEQELLDYIAKNGGM